MCGTSVALTEFHNLAEKNSSPAFGKVKKVLRYRERRQKCTLFGVVACAICFILGCSVNQWHTMMNVHSDALDMLDFFTLNEVSSSSPSQDQHRAILGDVGRSILITGAAGFISMHTALELKKKYGVHVIALDNMNDYYSVDLKEDRVKMLKEGGVEFIKGDVCDENLLGQIIQDHNIDRVLHLAAQAGVRFSIESPHSYTRNNVDCFVSVLEQFVKADLRMPLVYASSSSVYGFNNDAPFTEDVSDVDHPASLYAATKRSDELIAHTYNHLYNVSSVGLRFFTVYGPFGRPDMSPMIFADKISRNESLKLSNFGNNFRDFTFISDIVEGIISALLLDTNRSEILNLGCSNPIKLTYFVKLMEERLETRAVKELVPMENGDVPRTYANVTKANALLGWSPKIPPEEGITMFLDWFKSHNASKYMRPEKVHKHRSGFTQQGEDDLPRVSDIS